MDGIGEGALMSTHPLTHHSKRVSWVMHQRLSQTVLVLKEKDERLKTGVLVTEEQFIGGGCWCAHGLENRGPRMAI